MKSLLASVALVALVAFFPFPSPLRAEVSIEFNLAAATRVSLAVYDEQGRQLRTLLAGAPQDPGPHKIAWDGLDWMGNPAPAGSYEWRLLESQGLKAEFLLRLGTSFNNQEWPCNHDGPQSVLVEGDQALLSGGGEFVPHGVGVSLTNGALLGHFGGFPPLTAITGGRILSLNGDTLVVSDQQTNARLSSRDLLHYAKRLDMQTPEADLEKGWQAVPLLPYAPDRGFGWDNVDGLKAATDVPGSRQTLRDFHGPDPDSDGLAADLGADPCALFVFRIDVPRGRYNINLLMGNGVLPFDVDIYAGMKEGKPAFLRTEKFELANRDTPACLSKTISFELDTTERQIVLGFQTPKRQKGARDPQNFWTLRGVEVLAKPGCLAASGQHLAVGYPANGTVRWLDPATKDLKDLGSVTVENLRDVDLLDDGHAVVVTTTSLVEVARGTPPVIKATGFTRGKFISIDRSNGDILVAGERDGPVYRYDRNYQLKATYGRVGGRQQGPYNPEDFCALHDLASDNRGGFLVVENWSAPRRLAHFGPDGKLIKEWCGGQLFFTGAAADPTDPRRVWINSHWGWLMEVEADYDAHTWKTRATYCLTGLGEGFVPDGGTFNRWTLRRHGEHRYLIAAGRAPCVLLVDDAKRRLLPLVIAGSGEGKSKVVHSVLEEANKQKPAGGGWYGAFLWQERNDNGQIDAEEVRPSVVNGSGGGPGGGSWSVDADMTFYHWQTDKDGFLLYRLPVKEWVGARPVYPNWDDVTPVRLALTPEQVTAHKTWWGGDSLGVAPNGDAYMQVQGKGYEGYAMQFWAAPAHSSLWPNNMIGEAALCKWSPSKGGLEWRVGRLSTSWAPTVPGTLNSRAAVLGQVHGCMLFSSRVVQPMEAWTEDGLYAGAVFDRRAADGLPGAYYSWWRGQGLDGKTMDAPIQADMLMGGGMAPMPNGAVLFFGCGWNNVPVYRVTGWDSFHRQSGRVELKKPPRSAAGTGTGLYGEFFTEEEMKGEPVRRRITPRLWVGGDYWPKTDNGVEAAVVRWTGSVEARFSEDYQLKTYTANDRVRIWLADRLILDSWSATNRHDRTYSGPVPLKAGEKTPIRIEYAKMGKGGDLHVCWESASQEIEHIPHPCLYPPEGAKADPEPAASPPSTGPSLEKYLIDLKQEDTAMPKDLDELLGPNGSPE